MKKFLLLILISSSIFFNIDVNAQNVDIPDSVKKTAHCEETYIEGGGWYHTFGKGRCPPGSKKSFSSKKPNCPPGNVQPSYECATQRLDDVSDAFDAARNALLAWGELKDINRYTKDFLRVSNVEIEILDDYKIEEEDKYIQTSSVKPLIGDISSSSLGNPILSTKTGYFSDCITPIFDFKKNKWGGKYNIYKNKSACKIQKSKKQIFYTTHFNVFFDGKPPMKFNYELKNKKKRGEVEYSFCLNYPQLIGACASKKKEEDFNFGIGFVSDKSLPKTEIIFSKKSGDILLFKVAKNNIIEDIVLQLTKSNILEYEGAKIEIVNATESELTFKVLSYFE